MEHQILQLDRSIEVVMRGSFTSSNQKQTEGSKQSTNHSFLRCQLSLPNLLSIISSSNTPSNNYCSRRTSSIRDDKWASQLITMGLFSRMWVCKIISSQATVTKCSIQTICNQIKPTGTKDRTCTIVNSSLNSKRNKMRHPIIKVTRSLDMFLRRTRKTSNKSPKLIWESLISLITQLKKKILNSSWGLLK